MWWTPSSICGLGVFFLVRVAVSERGAGDYDGVTSAHKRCPILISLGEVAPPSDAAHGQTAVTQKVITK